MRELMLLLLLWGEFLVCSTIKRRVFSGCASNDQIMVASAKAYMFALNRLIAGRREATRHTEA